MFLQESNGRHMKNRKILIIGGTGALGKTLVKRYYNNNDVIVLSRDEHKHHSLKQVYPDIKNMIGDIKDKNSIKNCLIRFNPGVVINAAALKHVPICEDDPFESVKTNIVGHQNVIEAVTEVGNVKDLIFVSTDKACNPINVYGMCKSISERLYVEYAKQQKDMKVMVVRYGNVLESTGSVIPFFKKLLDDGVDNLPITDVRMTRFVLTLDDAVDLINWTYYHNESHGKIAVPKVKSVKVTDIAKSLIHMWDKTGKVGLIPIGIRPGEKLHEEMVSAEEWRRVEELDNFFLITDDIVNQEMKTYNSLDSLIDSEDVYDFLIENGVTK